VRTGRPAHSLPAARSLLAVVAHPDDESFGLGAILAAFARSGTKVTVLCFSAGEASSLGRDMVGGAFLHEVRAQELSEAAAVLGVAGLERCRYPDGRLEEVDVTELAGRVEEVALAHQASLLLTFDEGGVTGHPDHKQATRATLVAAERLGLAVLGWTVPQRVAARLNAEMGTSFTGRSPAEVDFEVPVERAPQLSAIALHRTQSLNNAVLWRRLELTGGTEVLRVLKDVPGSPVHSSLQGAP
jgi:LmbE family N-acetylglucosaminyl deacetylase